MTVQDQLRQKFADDTEYERLVLETIVEPNKAPPGAVFATNDIRGERRSFSRGVHESIGGGAAEGVTLRLRPLAIGAAYKILDLLLELVMRLNSEPCPAGRWTFEEKNAFIRRGLPSQLPVPIDSTPAVWLRTGALYAALVEHRHALVHRRARVEINGDFTGSDRAGAPLPAISATEQDALNRFVAVLADTVIVAAYNPRHLHVISFHLDALTAHHGYGRFGVPPPLKVVVKVIDDMQSVGAGRWRVNGAKLHAHLRDQQVRPEDADAELRATVGGEFLVFTAHIYEVPDSEIEVIEAFPPPWLRQAR